MPDLYAPPGLTDDVHVARLPFYTAQRLLASAPEGGFYATVEWHGTDGIYGDPERGSFVMVREGYAREEELVGERLLVGVGPRQVWAYCHRAADLDEDLSVTRRLALALGPLAASHMNAYVRIGGG